MGEQLAELLEDAIQERIDNDDTEETTREDVVGLMAEGSGVERGTINEIIEGEIECPPPDRVPPLSRDLPIDQSDVEGALADDGCSRFESSTDGVPSYKSLSKRYLD